MKKILFIAAIIAFSGTKALAQCGSTYVLTSSKTEHLDASGAVKETRDEKAEIEIGKTNITVFVNGNQEVNGVIKENTCNWTIPYKEGKSVIKTVVNEQGNSDEKNATMTIEGKNGKVTILFEIDGIPDNRIRVAADNFVEKKG